MALFTVVRLLALVGCGVTAFTEVGGEVHMFSSARAGAMSQRLVPWFGQATRTYAGSDAVGHGVTFVELEEGLGADQVPSKLIRPGMIIALTGAHSKKSCLSVWNDESDDQKGWHSRCTASDPAEYAVVDGGDGFIGLGMRTQRNGADVNVAENLRGLTDDNMMMAHDLTGDKVTLKTKVTGKYCYINHDGKINCDADSVPVESGQFLVTCLDHCKGVPADPSRGTPLADRHLNKLRISRQAALDERAATKAATLKAKAQQETQDAQAEMDLAAAESKILSLKTKRAEAADKAYIAASSILKTIVADAGVLDAKITQGKQRVALRQTQLDKNMKHMSQLKKDKADESAWADAVRRSKDAMSLLAAAKGKLRVLEKQRSDALDNIKKAKSDKAQANLKRIQWQQTLTKANGHLATTEKNADELKREAQADTFNARHLNLLQTARKGGEVQKENRKLGQEIKQLKSAVNQKKADLKNIELKLDAADNKNEA